jgi:hypothetical protein
MDENVLPGGALDKTVALGSVEPLHCTLLSHKSTPFASANEFSNLPVGLLYDPLSGKAGTVLEIELRAED